LPIKKAPHAEKKKKRPGVAHVTLTLTVKPGQTARGRQGPTNDSRDKGRGKGGGDGIYGPRS